MNETIQGVYRNGKIELLKQPIDAEDTRVLVTFLRAKSGPRRDASVKALFDEMDKGINLGGGPYPKREELYDRGRPGPR